MLKHYNEYWCHQGQKFQSMTYLLNVHVEGFGNFHSHVSIQKEINDKLKTHLEGQL